MNPESESQFREWTEIRETGERPDGFTPPYLLGGGA